MFLLSEVSGRMRIFVYILVPSLFLKGKRSFYSAYLFFLIINLELFSQEYIVLLIFFKLLIF